MSAADTLVSLAGPTLLHVTARGNAASIREHGLKPAAQLAREAGIDPGTILLRQERTRCGAALLNHQRPLRMGYNQAARALDGHGLESWAQQLDNRVFFWPAHQISAFHASIKRDVETEVLTLDTRAFARALSDRTFLSPINSGAFLRRAAHRGDWLYVPLDDGPVAFRENRRRRSLVRTPDTLREVSVTGAISATDLATLLR